jgi:ABC-2 type transport system permease protein
MDATAIDPTQVPVPARRHELALVGWQIRYELRAFVRNRGRGLFTFLFPIMFLVIFGSLDQGKHLASRGGISYDQYFVPGILAYALISTTFVNMAIGTAILRDEGVLKRMQGTPLPRWAYLAGRVGATIVIVAGMTAIALAFGHFAYGVAIRAATLPGVIVTLLLGSAAFTMLGIGIVRFIPNAESAPAIVNLAVFPLTFISGIWFVTDGMPKWLIDVAKVFPVRAVADGLQYAFNPFTHGAGFRGDDLRTLAIWAVVGAWLMIRFLRTPLGESR